MQGKGIRRNGHLTADDSFERQFFDSQFIGKGSSGNSKVKEKMKWEGEFTLRSDP